MEYFDSSTQGSMIHIDGFPDAEKVICLNGPRAKRLSDLLLHKADLDFADECLGAINLAPEEPFVLREALWRSAIVHFFKCCGDAGSRFQLSPEKILKGEPPEALDAFNYFKYLRNKHLVHDENSYNQSVPGAILNKGNKEYKIEKVVCFAARAVTLDNENFGNLKLLIEKSRFWVVAEFDQLCDSLAKELELESYENLHSRKSLIYRAPTIDEIQDRRKAP